MAFEQYHTQKWKSDAGAGTGTENISGCFDCNICLDFAREPVVTMCGHLYCWPCIYKWLHVQSASLASDEHPQCPVCKSDISHTTMVPLYGRGQAGEAEAKPSYQDMNLIIPPRPTACGTQSELSNTLPSGQQLVYRNPYRNQHGPPPYSSLEDDSSPPPMFSVSGSAMSGVQNPMIGEMVYATFFGNPGSLYAYPNSYYHLTGSSSSHRLRRHELQADKSLNRISIFLFCFFLVCLIVF